MSLLRRTRSPRVTRNLNEVVDSTATLGDRVADGLARFGGSWAFILLFLAILVLWIGVNSLAILAGPFDPYPFVFLNLILSCLAALQAPVILMSQNRQTARDRIEAEQDFATNLKAELEIEDLHQKLDALREGQWAELVQMQQRQIALLERLLHRHDPAEIAGSSADGYRPTGYRTDARAAGGEDTDRMVPADDRPVTVATR